MTKFTDFAETKDAVSFKEAFEDAVAVKVNDALDAKKAEIAANFFGQVAEAGGIAASKTAVKGGKWPSPPAKGASKLPGAKAVKEDAEQVVEEPLEKTRSGRLTGDAIKDIVAKNNARLASKKKAAAMKKAAE
jgi:hypothetical protein